LLTRDPHLAQDIVQDAFVRAFGRFGHLRHAGAFSSYLRKIVINLARDHFRHRAIERLAIERVASVHEATAPPADQLGERDAMWEALLALPYRQRAVLVLRYYEDLTEAQTAELLDCSVSAVKSLANRAMKSLRVTVEGP
jgi:RNA polymerase sigma-70 factor (sigma-E family)